MLGEDREHRLRLAILSPGPLPELLVLRVPLLDPAARPRRAAVPVVRGTAVTVTRDLRRERSGPHDGRNAVTRPSRSCDARATACSHRAAGRCEVCRLSGQPRADEPAARSNPASVRAERVGVLGVQREPVEHGAQQHLRPLARGATSARSARRRRRPRPTRRRRRPRPPTPRAASTARGRSRPGTPVAVEQHGAEQLGVHHLRRPARRARRRSRARRQVTPPARGSSVGVRSPNAAGRDAGRAGRRGRRAAADGPARAVAACSRSDASTTAS